ncbi:hypothetical protein PGT21_035652 [Puccinia graminis f. sp. tritici]|uniref:Uncharacterized protein n=1 Tax=Puccinia graminis f. sp. tritici TaxID=56615 RepID=A0A5B0P0Q4_PUCGR|nr:hypothetical protein PGT21_035652 [Puccinia graminis f. sp. tritici]
MESKTVVIIPQSSSVTTTNQPLSSSPSPPASSLLLLSYSSQSSPAPNRNIIKNQTKLNFKPNPKNHSQSQSSLNILPPSRGSKSISPSFPEQVQLHTSPRPRIKNHHHPPSQKNQKQQQPPTRAPHQSTPTHTQPINKSIAHQSISPLLLRLPLEPSCPIINPRVIYGIVISFDLIYTHAHLYSPLLPR